MQLDEVNLGSAETAWRLLIACRNNNNQIYTKLQEMKMLSTCSKEEINFSSFKFGDEGINILSETICPQLSVLIIGNQHCVNAGGNEIVNVDKIHQGSWRCLLHLSLNGNQLKNVDKLHKANWPQLQRLYLGQNLLTDVDKLHQANWTRLQKLYLRMNKLTNVDRLHQASWPQLQELHINGNQLNNVDRLHEANWPRLNHLNLEENSFIDGPSTKQKLQLRFPSVKIYI